MKSQIEADQKADFFDAANQNRRFLSKIDSLEKARTEPSLILSEIETHLSESEK